MVIEENSVQLDIRTVVLVGRPDFGRCPLAARRPTALWPIADRPVLSRLLDHLACVGIRSGVVFCSEDAADSVRAVCEGAAIDVKVLTEDLTKGTAGCLRDAVASDPGDLLVVLSGSMVCPPSIGALIETHRASGAMLTTVFNPGQSDGAQYGAAAEIYLCEPAVLQHIPLGGYSDIKEGLIPSILRAGGTVQPVVLPADAGNFHDRQGYLDAVARYLTNGSGIEDGAVLHECSDRCVAPTTSSVSVHPTARIFGPVVIGEQTQLLEDALVVGPAVVGRHSVVGQGSAVVGSVLWEGARVGSRCEIRQSVVAQEAVVPDEAEVVEQAFADGQSVIEGSRWTETVARVGKRIDAVVPRSAAFIGLGIGIGLALLWSYWPTVLDLWQMWQRSDEYSAGLLVPFMAAYVVWSRRQEFADVPIRPALAAGTVAFLLAYAVRSFGLHRMYASAERLSLVLSITALVLLLFGRRFLWKLAPVLLFLCLMLPWPNRVQTQIGLPLQSMATKSAVFCLELIGSDVQQDGNVIRIGDTRVEVAAACNGLRMIMAFFVVSGLVALLARRAWWEKLVVLLSSLPIALCCNTLRLTVTALLFTVVKDERLERLSHDFGGYAMMPLALALMVGELWLLARLTTPPVAVTPEVIARRKPRHAPGP
jgi:exosortase